MKRRDLVQLHPGVYQVEEGQQALIVEQKNILTIAYGGIETELRAGVFDDEQEIL